MNIDGDYLWDKTGEPDPEIQQLEEVLSTLRYEPRPLEIPVGLEVGRNRSFFRDFGPRLAIAATIAMVLLGLGLWVGLQRLQRSQLSQVTKAPGGLEVTGNPSPAATDSRSESQTPKLAATAPEPDQKPMGQRRRNRLSQSVLAGNSNRGRSEVVKNPQLALSERQEAEAAKNQLMLALRVASAKLNFAQKKAQSTNPRDLIHNQHKIG